MYLFATLCPILARWSNSQHTFRQSGSLSLNELPGRFRRSFVQCHCKHARLSNCRAYWITAEHVTRTLSLGIFLVIYLLLCYRIIRKPALISTLRGMIGWMAVTWLAYCALGSPWFWPWYVVTFFGLYALIETSTSYDNRGLVTYFVRLLTFSLFIIYFLNSWAPIHSFVPGLPGFLWSYLNGLFVWILPLTGAIILSRVKDIRFKVSPQVLIRK